MGEERQLQLLRKVRLELSERPTFICLAIMRADGYNGSKESQELRAYVESALRGNPSYCWWVVASPKRGFLGAFLGYGFDEGRLAWVDAMIKALENGRCLPKRPVPPPWLTWVGAAKHLISKFRRNATC